MSTRDSEYVEIVYDEEVRETVHARLLRIDGRDVWLPKSQIDDVATDGENGTVSIPEWLAIEKELV